MQQFILSDRREEQLRRLRVEREQRYQQARIVYRQELRFYDDELTRLAETTTAAFRGLHFLSGAAAWWRHRTLLKRGDPSAPLLERPSVEEHKQQAAAETEQRLVADLVAFLPGAAWTLIKGYRNRKGEIDYLLVGPVGILALACLHLSGTVLCNKDRWMRQKYDPKGAPVTQVPIQDRNGRSPSQQLNEPVMELMELLSRKSVRCDVSRAVILTHEDVRLSTVEESTVQIIVPNKVQALLWEICRSASSSISTDHVVEFVKEDHATWQEHHTAERRQQHG